MQEKSGCGKTLLLKAAEKTAIAVLGIAANIPFAVIGYKNNNDSIFWGVVPLIDSGLSIYSLELTAGAVRAGRRRARHAIRDNFIARLEAYRAHLPTLYQKENPLLSYNAQDPMQWIENIVTFQEEALPEPSRLSTTVSKIAGWAFGASQLWLYGLVTLDGMKLVTDNEIGQYAGLAGVTAINACLEGTVTTASIQHIWNKCRGTSRPTLASTFFPKMRALFSAIDLTLSTLCYNFPAAIAKQEMTSRLSPGLLPVQIVSSIGNGLTVTGSLQDVFDTLTFGLAKSRCFGSDRMREILSLDRRLAAFIEVVKEAPPREFDNFYAQLNPEIKESLVGHADIC